MQKRDGQIAKFMLRWDGPYEVMEAYPDSSDYKLRFPDSSKRCARFHSSQLKRHIPNDDNLFTSQSHQPPQPIVTEDGQMEYFIEQIIDEQPRGQGKQYLVRWLGYRLESDLWLPRSELLMTEALEKWEESCGSR